MSNKFGSPGLESETEYNVTVYSANSRGRSNLTLVTTQTIPSIIKPSDNTDQVHNTCFILNYFINILLMKFQAFSEETFSFNCITSILYSIVIETPIDRLPDYLSNLDIIYKYVLIDYIQINAIS